MSIINSLISEFRQRALKTKENLHASHIDPLNPEDQGKVLRNVFSKVVKRNISNKSFCFSCTNCVLFNPQFYIY